MVLGRYWTVLNDVGRVWDGIERYRTVLNGIGTALAGIERYWEGIGRY